MQGGGKDKESRMQEKQDRIRELPPPGGSPDPDDRHILQSQLEEYAAKGL